jgi:hypothetical protein
MNPAQLRNKIDWEGGVVEAMDYGIRDSDIDDEDLSELWYEMQVEWDVLSANISDFMDLLNSKLDDSDLSID